MTHIIKQKRLLTWFLLIIMLLSVGHPAYAAEPEKQTVRVAYFNLGEYYRPQSDGTIYSYDTDVLSKISDYSNLEFEYVDCGTWTNALDMLRRQEVDLVGTVQWTPEREELYEFCLGSYGYTVAELAALQEKNYAYEDYETIGNSTIGYTKKYVRKKELHALLEAHNISPVIKTYDTEGELQAALESGEIDIIAANSHALHNDWNVMEKISYSPYFFISWNGNTQLIDQIDDAMIQMRLSEPTLDDTLMMKYFPNILGAPLTKEELNLISENKTYTIYYNDAVKPLAWYDEATDTMQGGLVDISSQISNISGLDIRVRPLSEKPDAPTDTTISFTLLFDDSESCNLTGTPGVTDALIHETFNLYQRGTQVIDIRNGSFSIAIVKNRYPLKDYIQKKYPNCSIVEYDTPVDCIYALEKGDIDFVHLNLHVADSVFIETGITDVRQISQNSLQHGIAMRFEGTNSELLANIVNKSISKIDQEKINNALVQYALQTNKKLTFFVIWRDYRYVAIICTTLLILIFLSIAILLTYAYAMRKEKDKVMCADADRAEFFARMSHDMRTPMNGILGMIRLSQEETTEPVVLENMRKAENAGKYMLNLINDTLDLQRIESKKLVLETEVVSQLAFLNDIFSMMKITAEEKRIAYFVELKNVREDLYVEIDPVRSKQIIANLVSNAIKFTPEGGAVSILFEVYDESADMIHIKFQVKDTGVGMSEDFIKNRLYKPYSQENNRLSNQLTGSGLGMAIVKNLVEIMGGSIEIESQLGEGTTFTVCISVKKASKEKLDAKLQNEEHQSQSAVTSIAQKRILLCEDHPLNAEIAKLLLEKVGCIIELAQNGKLGVEKFKTSDSFYYDAIFMDIRMPEMDGLEATRTIRSLDRADATIVPIIAMTANAYESDVQNCMDAGMNAHLAKPIEPQKMYQILAEQITRR